jgi:hypothetical protein
MLCYFCLDYISPRVKTELTIVCHSCMLTMWKIVVDNGGCIRNDEMAMFYFSEDAEEQDTKR